MTYEGNGYARVLRATNLGFTTIGIRVRIRNTNVKKLWASLVC